MCRVPSKIKMGGEGGVVMARGCTRLTIGTPIAKSAAIFGSVL